MSIVGSSEVDDRIPKGSGRTRRFYRHKQIEGAKVLQTAVWLITGWLCLGNALAGDAVAGAASTNLADMPLERLIDYSVDKVYGASRYEQKVTEAPSSVSIVTADDIQHFGYRTLTDVLRGVRGMYVTYDRNYSSLGMRGFARPGDYNTRLLLLVDGHRMNDNIYDAAYYGTDAFVDVDLIERVEVIRGPSSSLYGNSAFFGVINVVTKPGAEINGLQSSVEAGSLDTFKARFTAGKKFTNDVELLVSGTLFQSEGQERLFYREFNTPATHHGIVRNSDEETAANIYASVKYRDFTLSSGFSGREKNVPTASFGSVFADGREQTLDLRAYADLKYERAITDERRLLVRVYYDQYHYNGTYPYVYDPGSPVVLNRDVAVGDWAGAECQWTEQIADPLTITGGVELRENIHQDQFNYDETPRSVSLRERNDSVNIGVYGQCEWAVRQNLHLTAGLRYDYFETFGSSVNPRAGLIYNPWNETTFKLLYGRAFRAPNAYELHYYPIARKLDAETIDTVEWVYEQVLPAEVHLTGSLYHYEVQDLISQQETSSHDLYFANIDGAAATGVELELERRWSKALARVSYALQNAEDSHGEELSNSPRHLAKANLRVPLFSDRFFGGIELQYNGAVRALDRRSVDDFVQVNLTLFAHHLAPGLDVSASVYNLFDMHYAYPGAGDHVQRAIEQDGRGFRVKLTYSF